MAITLEMLYDILRNEKTHIELIKLHDTFYDDVLEFFKEKQKDIDEYKKKVSIFVKVEEKKTRDLLENAKKIFIEVYNKRENKILNIAIANSRSDEIPEVENLLREEKQLFESLISTLKLYRQGIIENLTNLERPKIETIKFLCENENVPIVPEDKNMLVRILADIPPFVYKESEKGPFFKEDIVNLEKELGEFLVSKKRAEII